MYLHFQHSSLAVDVIEIPYHQATKTTGVPGSNSEKLDDIAQKLDHLITTANANEINVQVLFDRQQNVNRGFRDSLPLLRSCGYNVLIPLSPEDNEPQLTTSQANKSKAVTLCRWVVEVVNGIFKSKFKLFR